MISTATMSLRVNILTVPNAEFDELIAFAKEHEFAQFTMVEEPTGWSLSAPLSNRQQLQYQWLYHRMAAREKASTEPPKPPNGKPPKGPTPPTGGTPGAIALEEPQELLMVA